jgi:hypothetical protein
MRAASSALTVLPAPVPSATSMMPAPRAPAAVGSWSRTEACSAFGPGRPCTSANGRGGSRKRASCDWSTVWRAIQQAHVKCSAVP